MSRHAHLIQGWTNQERRLEDWQRFKPSQERYPEPEETADQISNQYFDGLPLLFASQHAQDDRRLQNLDGVTAFLT